MATLPLGFQGESSFPFLASFWWFQAFVNLWPRHSCLCLHLHVAFSSVCLSALVRTLVPGFRAHSDEPRWPHPLKVLNLITSTKTVFSKWVTFTGSRGSGVDVSLGDDYSPHCRSWESKSHVSQPSPRYNGDNRCTYKAHVRTEWRRELGTVPGFYEELNKCQQQLIVGCEGEAVLMTLRAQRVFLPCARYWRIVPRMWGALWIKRKLGQILKAAGIGF